MLYKGRLGRMASTFSTCVVWRQVREGAGGAMCSVYSALPPRYFICEMPVISEDDERDTLFRPRRTRVEAQAVSIKRYVWEACSCRGRIQSETIDSRGAENINFRSGTSGHGMQVPYLIR